VPGQARVRPGTFQLAQARPLGVQATAVMMGTGGLRMLLEPTEELWAAGTAYLSTCRAITMRCIWLVPS
jgi:hypothetical protein